MSGMRSNFIELIRYCCCFCGPIHYYFENYDSRQSRLRAAKELTTITLTRSKLNKTNKKPGVRFHLYFKNGYNRSAHVLGVVERHTQRI